MSLRTELRARGACLRIGTDGKVHVLHCSTLSRRDKPHAKCGRGGYIWLATALNVIDCAKCARWASAPATPRHGTDTEEGTR